jgi:tetratricopeptide (TPR) repeat protein
MRRKLGIILVAVSISILPAKSQADCCWNGCGYAAGFALGFLVPVITMAAVQAATAPSPSYNYYYEPPPSLPQPAPLPAPEPPPVRERIDPIAAHSQVGEVSAAQPVDPARAEAERLLRAGEFLKALEAYRALARERPQDRQIALRFAESLLAVGNYRYAELSLRRALRGGATLESLQAIEPAALLAQRRAALEKRIPLDAKGSGRLLAAYAALAAGDQRGALDHLRPLLSSSPANLEAFQLAGVLAAGKRLDGQSTSGSSKLASGAPSGR